MFDDADAAAPRAAGPGQACCAHCGCLEPDVREQPRVIDHRALDEQARAALSPEDLVEIESYERYLDSTDWEAELLDPVEGVLIGPDPESVEAAEPWDEDPLPPVDPTRLAVRGPNGFMIDELARADVTRFDDFELVDALGCFKRLEAVAAAGMREVAAELGSRSSMVMTRPRSVGKKIVFRESLAADEVMPKLGCSRFEANRLVRVGQLLDSIAGPTGDALAAGLIDAGKADVIAVAVAVLDAEAALEVQEEILPKAASWPKSRVAREVAKLVAAADPTQFNQRAAIASTRRYVGRARVDVDGMASQSIYWPTADALAMDLLLDSAASTAKAAGDLRTLEQLRADVLADIIAHGLNVGKVADLSDFTFQLQVGPCTHGAAEHRCDCDDHGEHDDGEHDRGEPSSSGSEGAAPGDVTTSGEAAPPSPPDPTTSGSMPPDPTVPGSAPPDPTTTGPVPPAPTTTGSAPPNPTAPGSVRPDPTTTGPVPPAAASTGSVPPDPTLPGTFLGSWGGADTGETPRVFTPGADRGLPRTWPVGVLGGRRAQILVRMSLSTLMGGDAPADIEGLGPVPAEVGRAFVAGGTLRRIVTDPITDRVVDFGTERYEPDQNMIDRVKENEPYCSTPSCGATARMTELDHRIPFPEGHTCDANLDPKCRRCHLIKTHGGFIDEIDSHGNRFWRTPTGHVYMRTPDGTVTELARDVHTNASVPAGPAYRPPADPDAPPPF